MTNKKTNFDTISSFDKRGKGFAIIKGMQSSKKNFVVWIDDDGQFNKKEIPNLVDLNYDLVCGYRNWDDVPLKHKFANKLINFCFNHKFKTSFKDVSCGFIGFSRKFITTFLNNYSGGGYNVDYKIKLVAIKNNMKIKQVPVTVSYENTSTNLRGFLMVAGILKHMMME